MIKLQAANRPQRSQGLTLRIRVTGRFPGDSHVRLPRYPVALDHKGGHGRKQQHDSKGGACGALNMPVNCR